MKNKTMNLYCPKCDIDNYLKGIEKKVIFDYIGLYDDLKLFNCINRHCYDWRELMKYQVERRKK